jgi:hypothetical protein
VAMRVESLTIFPEAGSSNANSCKNRD